MLLLFLKHSGGHCFHARPIALTDGHDIAISPDAYIWRVRGRKPCPEIAAHAVQVNATERQIILQIMRKDAKPLIRLSKGKGPGAHPECFVAHEKTVLANPVLAR